MSSLKDLPSCRTLYCGKCKQSSPLNCRAILPKDRQQSLYPKKQMFFLIDKISNRSRKGRKQRRLRWIVRAHRHYVNGVVACPHCHTPNYVMLDWFEPYSNSRAYDLSIRKGRNRLKENKVAFFDLQSDQLLMRDKTTSKVLESTGLLRDLTNLCMDYLAFSPSERPNVVCRECLYNSLRKPTVQYWKHCDREHQRSLVKKQLECRLKNIQPTNSSRRTDPRLRKRNPSRTCSRSTKRQKLSL